MWYISTTLQVEMQKQNISGHGQQIFENKKIVDEDQQIFFSLHIKQIFPLIIWIFIEGEGDGIESRLPSFYFTTWFFFEQSTSYQPKGWPCYSTEQGLRD